jgi:putative acetyltransferase
MTRRVTTLAERLRVRPSRKADAVAIAALHRHAFGREAEAALALALIGDRMPTISLVGECDRAIVGHVLLSEIGAPVKAMALAPLAVAADYREMQIGSRLVTEAIRRATEAGYAAIFVVGDNGYYERFGFARSLAEPFEVAWQGRHFMALELEEGALAGRSGKLEYPREFHDIGD